MRIVVIVLAIIALLVIAMLIVGGLSGHGPQRHTGSGVLVDGPR